MVRGETDKNGKRHPGQIFHGQNSGRNWEEMPSWRRGKNDPMKNRDSTMPEDYEEFVSLILRTRSSQKPLRMLARNWKRRWLLLCLARRARRTSMEGPVAILMISSLNLHVSWKPVNPQDCVWKNLYRIFMSAILQEKEIIHYSIRIWFTNLFLCSKPWRFPQQKQRRTRNGKNWRKFRRGTWRKSEVKKRWSMKQGRRAQKFILHH